MTQVLIFGIPNFAFSEANSTSQMDKLTKCFENSDCQDLVPPEQTTLESAFSSNIGLETILSTLPVSPKDMMKEVETNGLDSVLDSVLPNELGNIKILLINLANEVRGSPKVTLSPKPVPIDQPRSPASEALENEDESGVLHSNLPSNHLTHIDSLDTPVMEQEVPLIEAGIWPANNGLNIFQIISSRISTLLDRL